MKIPFLSRLLEIKEWQKRTEKKKLEVLREIRDLLKNWNI